MNHNKYNTYSTLDTVSEIKELKERFSIDSIYYSILPYQQDSEGNTMEINENATKYISNTARMIAEADGSSEKEGSFKPDTILFLDKSARPVSWFVQRFWKDLAVKDSKRPDFTFLNIDRTDIYNYLGVPNNDGRSLETGKILTPLDFDRIIKDPDSKHMLDDIINGIRAYYVDGDIDPNKDINKQIWSMKTKLDGKDLLIVDETERSGSTMHISKKLMKLAIPEIGMIRGEYFWPKDGSEVVGYGEDAEVKHGSVPIWYDPNEIKGRGIGDRNENYYSMKYERIQDQISLKQKLGSIALSAPILSNYSADGRFEYSKDDKAKKLADDIKQLRTDYRNGRVLLVPPFDNYSLDRMDEVLLRQGIQPKIDETGEYSWAMIRELKEDRKLGRI